MLLSSLIIQRANIKVAGYSCPRNSTSITLQLLPHTFHILSIFAVPSSENTSYGFPHLHAFVCFPGGSVGEDPPASAGD